MPFAPARSLSTMLRLVVLTALVAGLAFITPGTAHACSCAPPPPTGTALREADAVFVGSVTDVTDRGGQVVAHLAVEAVHAGEVPGEVQVHTATDSAACGYGFQVGRQDLVYALLDDDGRLLTTLCDRTAPVANATDDLEALGDGYEPAAVAEPGEEPRRGPLLAVGIALAVALAGALLMLRRAQPPDAELSWS